jgi:glucose-6-phosphate 1-epimerase
MDADIQSLNRQYAIPGHVVFISGPGGLVTAAIDNSCAVAKVTLAGAHVMTYARRGEPEVLWTSPVAEHSIGEAMRGGVPICWPWFGNHATDSKKYPIHGFIRAMVWNIVGTRACSDGSTELCLKVHDTAETRAVWPHAFEMETVITVGSKLRVEWIARSIGGETYTYTGALHPYFNISDIRTITIKGLEQTDYLDYADGLRRKTQAGPIRFVNETDRIYINTIADIVIEDPGLKRTIRIAKEGSQTTVVWNPDHTDAKMDDVGDGQHHYFVCVEAANAAKDVVTVEASGEARLAMEIWTEQGAES